MAHIRRESRAGFYRRRVIGNRAAAFACVALASAALFLASCGAGDTNAQVVTVPTSLPTLTAVATAIADADAPSAAEITAGLAAEPPLAPTATPTVTPIPSATSTPPPTVEPEPTATPTATPTPTPAPGEHRVGDCYAQENFEDSQTRQSIGCDQPHIAEVYGQSALLAAPGAAFPSLDDIAAEARAGCRSSLRQLTAVPARAAVFPTRIALPTEGAWDDGDRRIFCIAIFPEATTSKIVNLDTTRAFGLVSALALRSGDCLGDATIAPNGIAKLVDCEQPHSLQVYWSVPVSPGPEADNAALLDAAEDTCVNAFFPVIGTWSFDAEWDVELYYPGSDNVEGLSQVVSCVVRTDVPIVGTAITGTYDGTTSRRDLPDDE